MMGRPVPQRRLDRKLPERRMPACTSSSTDRFTASAGWKRRSPRSIRPTRSRAPFICRSARRRCRSACARRCSRETSSSAPTAATPSTWPRAATCKRLVAELYGKATGCTAGKGGSMHLIDPEAGVHGHLGRRRHDHRQRRRLRLRLASCRATPPRRQLLRRRGHRRRRLRREPELRGAEAAARSCSSAKTTNTPSTRRRNAVKAMPDICARARAHGMPAERIENNDVLLPHRADPGSARPAVGAGAAPTSSRS